MIDECVSKGWIEIEDGRHWSRSLNSGEKKKGGGGRARSSRTRHGISKHHAGGRLLQCKAHSASPELRRLNLSHLDYISDRPFFAADE